ncbi:MAG TPA: hypothetical protein VE987_14775, partial [Polyangiaceae bacterium]|nr:hypothetical protein [Polyangiaceae bacterium]
DGPEARVPLSLASSDVAAWLDGAERRGGPVWLGWTVARDVALAHPALIDEQLEDAAVALGSVLLVVAPASIEGGGVRPAGGARASGRREPRDRRQAEEERASEKRRPRQRERSRDREGDGETEADAASTTRDDAARPSEAASKGPSARGPIRAGARGRGVRAATRGREQATGAVEKGSRVRVLDGPFCGKVGVVHELDGKGGARVMLGLLAVRVNVRDLARCADVHGRPMLSTSHRKPVPVRS